MAKRDAPALTDREKQKNREQDVFLREVDDAVRSDDLRSFGTRYGFWIIGAVVVGLAALAGYIFYVNSLAEDSGVRSEEYVAAIDSVQTGNLDGAANALKALEDADQPGYRAAARIMQANIALERDDRAKAVAGYGAVVADDDLPQPFRDLALVRQTAAEFDSMKPAAVIARLKGLASPDNPWFGSAGEMVALAYLKQGKNDEAGALFARLAKDESVPATIRSRALQMAGLQGVDAVIDRDTGDALPGRATPSGGAATDSSESEE